MPEIQISVTNKVAQTIGTPVIICGNSDYVVQFTFDSEWDDYEEKTAVFRYYRNGERLFDEVLFSGDTVSVPVLRDIDDVEIGVYAGDIRTSTGARIPCARAITDGRAAHDPPKPDVYNQLLEYLANLQNGCTGIAELNFIGTDNSETGIAEPEGELGLMYTNAPLAMLSMDSPDIILSEQDEIEPQVEETEGI